MLSWTDDVIEDEETNLESRKLQCRVHASKEKKSSFRKKEFSHRFDGFITVQFVSVIDAHQARLAATPSLLTPLTSDGNQSLVLTSSKWSFVKKATIYATGRDDVTPLYRVLLKFGISENTLFH
ncbi:hypothetical protein CEXT_805391 [Caerostris extrusa]|uniref:Uncharacterized protein n=1 Tax=Caerostris extrusa TaxID=172846 RepID=A0AAV4W4L0_CAEEX|nr:hypothetical protein CEXT_805391 [Caerostris extrusa]